MRAKNILVLILVTCMLCSVLPTAVFGTGISAISPLRNTYLEPDTGDPAVTGEPDDTAGTRAGGSVLEYDQNGLHIILTAATQMEDTQKLFGMTLDGEMIAQANGMLESALKNKTADTQSGMYAYITKNTNPEMINVAGTIRWYTVPVEGEDIALYEITMMNAVTYTFKAKEIKYQTGEDANGKYIEFPCDFFAEGIYVFAKTADKPPAPDITMRITEADGQKIDPVSTWPVPGGSTAKLKAETTAPGETFYLYIGGALTGQSVVFTDQAGAPVSAEQLTRDVDRGVPGPIYKVTGAVPGAELNIEISGTVYGDDYSNVEGVFFVKEENVATFGKYSPVAPVSGGALCWLKCPTVAFELFDQFDNMISPPDSADSIATEYGFQIMQYLMTGAANMWDQTVRDTVRVASYEEMAGMDQLTEKIDGFVLLDKNGTEIERCEVGSINYLNKEFISVSFDRLGIGTYTVDVIPKTGQSIDFEPVTLEVKLEPKKNISAVYSIPSMYEGNPTVGLTEFVASNEYGIYVNGERVPNLSATEANQFYTLLSNQTGYSPEVPVYASSGSAAIARMTVQLPDAQQGATGVTMKIVEDTKKDAVTASYNDEIKWESVVNVGPTMPFNWIIELRYDVNNQNYPSGEGINPLFDYEKEVNVSLLLEDGTKVPLTEKENYTLDSPEGYFRIDKTTINGQTVNIGPREYNGTWPQTWYEIMPQNAARPYFLHPYFQKQVIRISQTEENFKLYQSLSAPVRSIIVESEGTLSEYAYTGGYGNPARVLAFGYFIPIPKLRGAKSLEENEASTEVPEYYLYDSRYVNLGYDTTAVYTAAVTVHKVDEDKKDLAGAEFVIEPQGTAPTPKAIQDEAPHLVLSHFIPGFSSIRPVPDSTDQVSRRNLTSIGEPARNSADPEGDATGEGAYLTYAGMKEGTYVIRESKAPVGYSAADDMTVELSAELPARITTGYEFCRWNAKVNGKEIPVVEQLADEYPDIDEEAYQMFSCNSSQIVLRVIDEHNDVSVQKVWDDDDNSNKARPDQVKVQLYFQTDAAGEKQPYGDPVTLNAGNEWTHVFEKLDADKIWSVEEVDVPEHYVVNVTGDQEEGFTVTNTYSDEKISFEVEKIWEDNGNNTAEHPSEIEVQLYYQEQGSTQKVPEGDPVKLSEETDWVFEWTELDATKTWSVEEVEVPENYVATVTGDQKTGFVITNTYTENTVEIDVKKVWEGPKKGIPESVTVYLLADGVRVDSKTLTANEGWTHTFTAPAENEDGTKIVYTVEEEQVKGFVGTVSGDQESGFTVTNKPKTEPDTGDNWNVLRWAVTSAISLIGIAVILMIYRRTNEKAC